MRNEYALATNDKETGDRIATRLHREIQKIANEDVPIEGALLVGYILISEWVSPKGERWLSRVGGMGHDAEEPLPAWTVKGYLSEAGETWYYDEVGFDDDGDDD